MKHKQFFLLMILVIITSAGLCQSNENNSVDSKISTDRWVEIDIYWFDHADMEKSAQIFWDRYYPLFENVGNYKGVILNVGWLMDIVYEWQGDLDKQIAFPKNMKRWPFIAYPGQLTGTSQQQEKLWKKRFEKAGDYEIIQYAPWTYADLKKLTAVLKKTAKQRYGLDDIRVGILTIGWEEIYEGEISTFAKNHPNAFLKDVFHWNVPNLTAKLDADSRKYGAYPDGIKQDTALTEFFGNQWGHLSKKIGLDVIILRDSILGAGVYRRTGPFGTKASSDPQKNKEWSRATADLVRYTKQANPSALVIGYSNAATAVGDWRVNAFDLEAIAKEGHLDGWIDQTWAGAWNEIGQRPTPWTDLWNAPVLGWTYHLGYMLGHAAVLADTDVRHYFLTETFDAWESWDIIHTNPDRLRWGIWAYSHAAVKKPDGLKLPAGSYISWGNQGKKLLSKEDVEFLAINSDQAIRNALNTKEVYGPTLVYNREAMKWQNENAPDKFIKEWIDEQAGTLMKWSVPILSITRVEYVDKVQSDFFIFQTPVHLSDANKQKVLQILNSSKPSAVFASPAGGLDPQIAELIGIKTYHKYAQEIANIGTLNAQVGGIFEGLPNTFALYHYLSYNELTKPVDTLYSIIRGGPALVLNNDKQLLFWDPPELSYNMPDFAWDTSSLDEQLGSPVPYVLTTRAINQMSKKSDLAHVNDIAPYNPAAVAFWQLKDGSYCVMAGNLEEGLIHTEDKEVQVTFNFPDNKKFDEPFVIDEIWQNNSFVTGTGKLRIVLDQGESKLYKANLEN